MNLFITKRFHGVKEPDTKNAQLYNASGGVFKLPESPCHLSSSTPLNYARSRSPKRTKDKKSFGRFLSFVITFVHCLVFNGVVCLDSLFCFRFHVRPVQWLWNSIKYSTCLSSPSTRAVMKFTFQSTKYEAVKIIFRHLMHLCKIFTFDRYNKLHKTVWRSVTIPTEPRQSGYCRNM
jgi:hypothetical protein